MSGEVKLTFMQKCIIKYLGERIPSREEADKKPIPKGEVMEFTMKEMAKAKDTGIKGSAAGTARWPVMFESALKDLVKAGYIKEIKGFMSSKLTLTESGFQMYEQLKQEGQK